MQLCQEEGQERVTVLDIPMIPMYPLFFMEMDLKKGLQQKGYNIVDIAPTIANVLQIEAPNSTSGEVVSEALQK